MREAAAELAQSLLAGNADGDTALTIVPYDSWVLPPAGMLNHFTDQSGNGACADFENFDDITNTLDRRINRRNCNTQVWAQIAPYEDNASDAVNMINDLRARGTTSIDLAVRYGAAFFDPDLQPVISDLIANGAVDPVFEGRPYDWDEPGVVRALLLLTDGTNCCGQRGSTQQLDLQTLEVCTEMKEHDILVYTIAFQAPQGSVDLLQACASSENHFFNADISQIRSAFEAIGANIHTQALRLTL
jgi:hypothetical protein